MTTGGFKAASGAALFMVVAIIAFIVGGTRGAAAVECTGPFAKCAQAVGGKCEMENGKMRMIYYDKGGYSAAYEECVGKVYEAHGRPNPYRPSSSQKPAPKR